MLEVAKATTDNAAHFFGLPPHQEEIESIYEEIGDVERGSMSPPMPCMQGGVGEKRTGELPKRGRGRGRVQHLA